jgi:hypothetical protein
MNAKLLPLVGITVIVAAVTAGIIFATQGTDDQTETNSDGDTMRAGSIAELSNASDLVVVGTLKGEIGTRRIPQGDPNLPVNPKRFSIIKDFEISVAQYLKGSGEQTLTLSVLIGMENELRGEILFDDKDDDPLEKGVTYVLFLRRAQTPTTTELTSTAMDPWRFRLQNGRVDIHSEFPSYPGENFPTTEADLLTQIAAAR